MDTYIRKVKQLARIAKRDRWPKWLFRAAWKRVK